MANRKFGNDGTFFSDKAFKELEQIVKTMDRIKNVRKEAAGDPNKEVELLTKYNNQLERAGVNIEKQGKQLKDQYEREKEEFQRREKERRAAEKERKAQELARQQEKKERQLREAERKAEKQRNELEKKFNQEIEATNKKQYKQQKELNDLKEKALKIAQDTTISEKERNDEYNKVIQDYKNAEQRHRRDSAKQTVKESVIGSIFGTSSQDIQDIQDGTYGMKFAAKVFSKAVDTFKQAVKEGIDNNYNNTERTLNGIIASNSRGGSFNWNRGSFSFGGRSYSGYKQINNAINDQLSSEGLLNNIANTDVINAANQLTTSGGMGLEAAIAKGYQDTVIKYIVPYLDTSSEAYTMLEYYMPGISKNVAGTAISIRDQLDESMYMSKYATQLVELMEPVALNANKDLYSQEYQEIAAQASEMLHSGYFSSAAEAQNFVNKAFGMYMDPVGKIKNGSAIERLVATNMITSGTEDSPSAYLKDLKNTSNMMLGWGSNTVERNIISTELMGDSTFYRRYNDKAQYDETIIDRATADEQLALFEKQVGLADDFNTTEQKIETLMTNITADVGDIKNSVGNKLWGIGEVIVQGITTWLGAKIISGSIGKAAAQIGGQAAGGSGPGIAAALTSNGFAIGAFGAAAAITAAGFISDGIMQSTTKNMNKNKEYYETNGAFNEFIKTDENGNTINVTDTAKDLLSYGLDNEGSKGWEKSAGAMFNFVNTYKTNKFLGWGISREDRNQASFENMVTYAGIRNLSSKDTAKALLAWLMIADATGVIEDINGWNSAKIKEAFPVIYDSDEDAAAWIKNIQGWGNFSSPQLSTDFGKNAEYYIPKDFSKYHRYGLDNVPYDNYPAMLHEGEAVLTSATANELRNLLTEYRQTSTQAINFEVVIQNQTTALITKMGEIINAINSNNTSMFTTNADKLMTNNIIANSLTHMRSTKSF